MATLALFILNYLWVKVLPPRVIRWAWCILKSVLRDADLIFIRFMCIVRVLLMREVFLINLRVLRWIIAKTSVR